MATTQYIGARYVPLFYENPDDGSNAWHAGVAYDPLTIVTDINQNYTSKIPVPATVGRPSENPTYWVLTGAYNAQISALSTRVSDLEEDVSDLQAAGGKKFILIGDSYGYGVTPGESTSGGWIPLCTGYLSGYAEVYSPSGSLGGNYGFTGSLPFLTAIQSLESDITEPETITDIVVLGGTNENVSGSNLDNAIAAFCSYCHTTYPRAAIKIGCIGVGMVGNKSVVEPEYKKCSKYGAFYIADTLNLMCLKQYISSDNVHLTKAGYQFYAPYIMDAILNGHCSYKFAASAVITITDSTTIESMGNAVIQATVTENQVEMTLKRNDYTPMVVSYGTYPTSGGARVIGSIDLPIILPKYADQFAYTENYMFNTPSANYYVSTRLGGAAFYITATGDVGMMFTPLTVPATVSGMSFIYRGYVDSTPSNYSM